MQNYSPFQGGRAQPLSPVASTGVLPFVRRVYLLLTVGIIVAAVGGLVALYAGAPVALQSREGAMTVPPTVAFELEHGIVMLLVFFGAFFGANFARNKPGINVIALLGFTFVTGLFLAPSIFIAQTMATAGQTLDPSPVRDAFLLTAITFGGLTGYCFVTKRDFSFMGAALSTGLWVVIGASLLGFFFHSTALSLAVASVAVILFAGYILYDTSRILRSGAVATGDAVSAALSLFLDVINLFLALLRILSSQRRNG
ncbi:MAG: Bax inhibitor-1 family protein [Polyangiaceae bacterium]|jgi:modulator of FtsH protease